MNGLKRIFNSSRAITALAVGLTNTILIVLGFEEFGPDVVKLLVTNWLVVGTVYMGGTAFEDGKKGGTV